MNDPGTIGALFVAWSTIMTVLIRRTNGSGPLARKLDSIEKKLDDHLAAH